MTLTYARSPILLGGPLKIGDKRYKNFTDREVEQEMEYKKYANLIVKKSETFNKDQDFTASPWALILLID